jgi:hypothetical protein
MSELNITSLHGFHVKLTRINIVVPLQIIDVSQTLFELVLYRI